MANTSDDQEKSESKDDPLEDERQGFVREVGNQAVWSLSSCKPGKNIDELLHKNKENLK